MEAGNSRQPEGETVAVEGVGDGGASATPYRVVSA
jgi:hypothetical protein